MKLRNVCLLTLQGIHCIYQVDCLWLSLVVQLPLKCPNIVCHLLFPCICRASLVCFSLFNSLNIHLKCIDFVVMYMRKYWVMPVLPGLLVLVNLGSENTNVIFLLQGSLNIGQLVHQPRFSECNIIGQSLFTISF